MFPRLFRSDAQNKKERTGLAFSDAGRSNAELWGEKESGESKRE